MESGARKFSFKIKEEESLSDHSDSGVLKFHYPAGKSSLEDTDKNFRHEKKLSLKEVDQSKKIEKKKFSNHNYFGVKNHVDLFEVGKHYANLHHSGMKSFAFSGDQNSSVHHTILGLASFFNYHKSIKAIVFIDKFEGSKLAEYLKPTHVEVEFIDLKNSDDTYEVYSCDGIDVIELTKLKHIAMKMGIDSFQEFLRRIVNDSEIVFLDLPESRSINKEREFYLPILDIINSLSFVVDIGSTKINQVKEMNIFANKYQVAVEGVLLYKTVKG